MKSAGNKRQKGLGLLFHSSSNQILWFFSFVIALGIISILLLSFKLENVGTCIMGILASFIVGVVIGFLFSIPRIVQRNENINDSKANTGSSPGYGRYQQQVNTNLTEISDWLTKIIVGLGLVNLGKLSPNLYSIAVTFARGINPQKPDTVLAMAYGIIICFSILGFLFGYLVTRLYLASAFSKADQDAIRTLKTRLESTQAQLSSIETNQSLINQSLYSKKATTVATAGITEQATMERKGFAIEQLEQMANEYLKIEHHDRSELVRLKDNAANEMADFALQNKIKKEDIMNLAETTGNEALVLALAMVINALPEVEDFDRLMKVAPSVTRLHIKLRVLSAVNKLFNLGYARRANDRKRVSELLDRYRTDADNSLISAINATRALVKTSIVNSE